MIWAFFYRSIAASIAAKTSYNLEMLPGGSVRHPCRIALNLDNDPNIGKLNIIHNGSCVATSGDRSATRWQGKYVAAVEITDRQTDRRFSCFTAP